MKKKIQELVAESGLVPSDIVKLSDGRLAIGQASVWLKDFKLSMPAELLLEWYCRRKVEEGVGPLPAGRKKGFAEIFQPTVSGRFGDMVVDFVPSKVEMGELGPTINYKQLPAIPSLVTPEIEQMAAIRGDHDKAALESVLVPTSDMNPADVDIIENGGPKKAEELLRKAKGLPAKKSISDIKKEIPGLKTASEIPAKETGLASPIRGGDNLFDKPMTYKRRKIGQNEFFALYLASGWYKLAISDMGGRFEIGEVVYSLSDFKAV